MAALGSWVPLNDVPKEELRFGVVLNGGVSLAVWMGGAVLELDRLIKATRGEARTPAYELLLRLTGSVARTDVIAGTSAGGINGSALALAQVNKRADVGLLRDVWIEQGQVETLLRTPFRGAPGSLMKGDEYFLPEMSAALTRLAVPFEPRDREEAPIDLTIATTLLHGSQVVTADALGQQLPQTLHAAKFHWRRWPTAPATLARGECPDPFDAAHIRDTAARLAMASRASASFPVAFEPAFVPVLGGDDDRSDGARRTRPNMHSVVESWGDDAPGRDRSRFAVDGGLLANTPTAYALRAIEAMPAAGPVRRVMLLVHPHAPEPGLDPADRLDEPPTLSATLGGLLGALQAQGGRTFVEELEAHNRRAAGRRGTRSDILGSLGPARPGEADGQTLESLSRTLFAHYRRLRTWRAARDVAGRTVDLLAGLPAGTVPSARSWGYERVRAAAEGAQAWLDDPGARTAPPTSSTPTAPDAPFGLPYVPAEAPTDATPDVGPGWAWGVSGASRVAEAAGDLCRRLVWLLPRGEAYATVSAARCAVSRAAGLLEGSRRLTDEVWDTDPVLVGLEPTQSYWAFRLLCDRQLMLGGDGAGLAALAGQVADFAAAATWLATTDGAASDARRAAVLAALEAQRAHCAASAGSAGAAVRAVVDQLVTDLMPALAVLAAACPAQQRGAEQMLTSDARLDAWRAVFAPGPDPLSHEQVRTRLLQLEVANCALGDEVLTGSTMPVEIVQLSAQTQNAFTHHTRSADDKLGGMSVGRFGGFLKRSWRLNDWMWGRLDATTILCRTVLSPQRVRRAAVLSGYLDQPGRTPRALAGETVDDLVDRLLGPTTVTDPRIAALRDDAVDELADCFDVGRYQPGDLDPSMPALAALFAWSVHLDIVPSDVPALVRAIAADDVDGSNKRSHGQFFVTENQALLDRVTSVVERDGVEAVDPTDRALLLAAFDRAGIGREPLQGEASSDLLIRSATTAAAVGATVLDGPRSGLKAVRPVTRAVRGAMLVGYWGVAGLTSRAVIARALVLLGLAFGAILVTLAAFGAMPAAVSAPATLVGASLVLLALGYGSLRSGTMLHGLVLLTPVVPLLADAVQRARAASAPGDAHGLAVVGAVLVLALGLMLLGSLPATTGSVWTALSRLADAQDVPPLPQRQESLLRHRARGTVRRVRGVHRLLVDLGRRLLVVLVPLALAVWVARSGWPAVWAWLSGHLLVTVAVAVTALAVGTVASVRAGERLQVLAEQRTGAELTWAFRRVAHPAGVSAGWSVVYGALYLVVAVGLVLDPLDWHEALWAQALGATTVVMGLLLSVVVPVVVPRLAFAEVAENEVARARTVLALTPTREEFGPAAPATITPHLAYGLDLVHRDVAYRRWVAFDPARQPAVPCLTRAGVALWAKVERARTGAAPVR